MSFETEIRNNKNRKVKIYLSLASFAFFIIAILLANAGRDSDALWSFLITLICGVTAFHIQSHWTDSPKHK